MRTLTAILFVLVWLASTADAAADPLTCTLAGYRTAPGLTATFGGDALTVTWDGERNQELRLQFTLVSGVVTIRSLDIRRKGEAWKTLAGNVVSDFNVVAGLRRISNQQLAPLRGLGVELTSDIIESASCTGIAPRAMCCDRSSPSTSSITSAVPLALSSSPKTIAICGWLSEARTSASRWNRDSRSGSAASEEGRILMAT